MPSPSLEESLARLDALASEEWDDMPDPELLVELYLHGHAIGPALVERIDLDALKKRGAKKNNLDTVGWTCCAVLCDLALPETASAVTAALFRGADISDGDDLDWFLPHLWQFGMALEEPLLKIVHSPDHYWFFHSAAINTLTEIAQDNPEVRLRTLMMLRTELQRRYTEQNRDIEKITNLVNGLQSFKDHDSLPLIEKLFDENLVDEFTIGSKETFLLDFDKEYPRAERQPFLPTYQKQKLDEQETYLQMKADDIRRSLGKSQNIFHTSSQMPVTIAKKPGRNEPCWCGSGKKYKKCHLDEDQKKR